MLPDKMKALMGRQKFMLLVSATVFWAGLPVGEAEARTFRNCAAVRAKFPNGIAVNFGVVGTSGAYIDRRVYLQHQALDRDRDGIICEDESRQSQSTTTSTAVSSTTSTAVSSTTSTAVSSTSTARVRLTIQDRVPLTIPARVPLTIPARVPLTIPAPDLTPLCRINPTRTGCESVVTTTTTTPITFLAIGTRYRSNLGLTVTLISVVKSETAGSVLYTINYTVENENPGTEMLEGIWKVFKSGGGGTPQYGSFSKLFFGGSRSRSYTFEVLKDSGYSYLAYDDGDSGLQGIFFSNSPPRGALVFILP